MVHGRVVLEADVLRRLRRQRGLSQDDLASVCYDQRVRVSASTIKRAETGHPVLLRIAREFARYFDVPLEQLVRREVPDDPGATAPSSHGPSQADDDAVPLVGRVAELGQFDLALRHYVLARRGFVLQVRGEPGIGKSRLLTQFVRMAECAGLTTIAQSLQHQDGRPWYQPLAGILYTLLGLPEGTPGAALTEVIAAQAPSLALSDTAQMHLLSFLGGTLPEAWLPAYETMDFAARRSGENGVILHLLRRFPRPLLIAVEDLQWADVNLMVVLKHLAGGIADLPVLMVLASRPDDGVSAEVWGSGVMNTPSVALELAPLDADEASALAAHFAHVPAEFRAICVRLAEGNPLFLEQLLLNFGSLPEELPRSIESHVLSKLARLGAPDRAALDAASAIGDMFSPGAVREVTRNPAWLPDSLVAHHLITRQDDEQYAFCHALIRQSIYASLPRGERRLLHGDIAAWYRDRNPTLHAQHLAAAQRLGASQAYLSAAESMYEQSNYVDALTLVDKALALSVPDGERFEMVRLKATLLRLLALPEKSMKYLLEAAELASSDALRSAVWCELAQTCQALHRSAETRRALEQAELHARSTAGPGADRQFARIAALRQALAEEEASKGNGPEPSWIAPAADLHRGAFTTLRELSSRMDRRDEAACARAASTSREIRIGVLHSQTGFLRELEAGVLRATLLAFQEINEQGGVLGRRVVPVIADGRSSETVFMQQAAHLVARDDIVTLFGCSTSSSRRRVKPLIEDNDHLLFYPFQYEGIEASQHIAYLGPAPNQQALPGVDWLAGQGHRRFLLVGSDYVYPVVTNEVIKDRIANSGGHVVGERYFPLGCRDFRAAIDDIDALAPDAIILTLVGFGSNDAFLRQLHRARRPAPTLLSLVLSEDDLANIPAECTAGIYTVFSYFQNIDHPLNQDFVRRYRQRFGHHSRIGGYMESAYVGVYLWAKAVQRAESMDRRAITAAMKGVSHFGPGGVAYIDEENNHVWRHVRVARVGRDGEFHVEWNSPRPVRPEPFPPCKSVDEWNAYLRALRERWRGRWESPA